MSTFDKYFAAPPNDENTGTIDGFKRKLIIDHGLSEVNPVQCGHQECHSAYSYGPKIRDFCLFEGF